MKLKLLSLIAISSISANVFCQDVDVETNSSVYFEPTNVMSSDYSTTHTDNTNGHVGETIRIKTYHSFNVFNNSDQLKNYLVAETCEVDGKKYKKGWGFSLAPHGSKSFAEIATLNYEPTRKGSWKIESMTCVGNSSACSKDHATLSVN